MIASTQAFLKGGISQSPQPERRPQGYSPLRPESTTVDEPFREPVAKLGKMITDRVPVKLAYFDFDLIACTARVRQLNPQIQIFPLSALTGEDCAAWEDWLRDTVMRFLS